LPAGYTLENAEQPAPFASTGISEYKPTLGISKDGRLLRYTRSFYFGGNGALLYQVSNYPRVKAFFDALNKSDSHTVVLKQTATSQ
jgi:hypothetical protein